MTPRSPFSGTPGPSFHSPFWYPWSSFSTPSFFPPPNLPFPVIWVAGSLFVPPYGWPAVFTAPRFLPPRGFYCPAVFTTPRFLPLRGFYRSAFTGSLGGLCSSTALVLAAPQSSPLPGGSLFGPPYGTPGILTAPRFLPLRGFSRSAIFTAPRFLPLRGFYRSAIFTAPRFLPLRFHRFFGGLCSSTALELAAPPSSPTSGRLALWATLRYACGFTAPRFLPLRGFYRSAIFTAPRFLPLRGFYRSAVFTAPRFLPLRDFYRSAVFTAPRFFPLRFRRFFGGLYSSFLPPSLRPLPGAPCATGSSVASPVGHHSDLFVPPA